MDEIKAAMEKYTNGGGQLAYPMTRRHGPPEEVHFAVNVFHLLNGQTDKDSTATRGKCLSIINRFLDSVADQMEREAVPAVVANTPPPPKPANPRW